MFKLTNNMTQMNLSHPKTCVQLAQKIGNKGNYQKIIFISFAMQRFLIGFFSLGIGFLYLNQSLSCSNQGLLVQQCTKSVCKLPNQKWPNFRGQKFMQSLATQFGPFLCSDESLLNFLKTSIYFGSFSGFVIFSIISDNLGRKYSMMISWSLSCAGFILLSVSPNIYVAAVGIAISACGAKGSLGSTDYVLTQIAESSLRQRFLGFGQVCYTISSAFAALAYFLVKDWRYVAIGLILAPALAILVFFKVFLKDTPYSLLKNSSKQVALTQLNKIAKINGFQQQELVTVQDLDRIINFQIHKQKNLRWVSPIDIIRYKSLRITSICVLMLNVLLNFLFLGPILTISNFGTNPFLSQITFGIADCIAAGLATWKIKHIPRVKTGIYLSLAAALCTGILIFVEKPSSCDDCIETIIEPIFMFVFRFFITFQFCVLGIHAVQLYPQTIRAVGVSTTSGLGILSTIIAPFILGIPGVNKMTIFTLAAISIAIFVSFLEQTMGKPLKHQVQELKQQYTTDKVLNKSL